MLTIEPRNGLANRLRVIDSGIELAKKLNKRLVIDWVLNEDLNCRFDSLFEPIDSVILNDGIKLSFPFRNYLKLHFYSKALKFDISFDQGALISKLGDGADLIRNEEFIGKLKKIKKIFICTGESFFNSPGNYHCFRPNRAILDKVDSICGEIGDPFIGLHIRRSDNKKATSHSPTSLFIETMRSIMDKNDKTKFFLSTDSPEDEILIKNSFKNNVYTFPKILDRNNETAIKAALVDMLCLSRASVIYGSYYSSFSEAASYFSGNELIVLKNFQ